MAAPRRAPRPPEVLPGRVPAHGRGDADPRGADPGRGRVRGGPRRRRGGVRGGAVRPRAARGRGPHPGAGGQRGAGRLPAAAAPGGASPCTRCSPRCAPRRARWRSPSSRCGTGTRAWSASTSPAPRRAARPPGTWTRSSTWPGRTSTSPSTPGKASGCRPSGRRCNGAGPSASATACGSWTTSGSARTAHATLGRLASYVRDRRIPLEMCPLLERADRRGPVHRGAPDRAAAPAVLPGHREHRQPADERGQPVLGVRAARWRRSGTAGPTSNGSRSTR